MKSGSLGEPDVGDRYALLSVEPCVLDQVVRVRPAPVPARAGRALQPAQGPAVGLVAVGLHVPRGAPRVGVEAAHPVRLGLLCQPHLPVVIAVPHILRRRVRATRIGRLDGGARRGADAQPQDAQAGTGLGAEQQVQHLPLPLWRQAIRAAHDIGPAEEFGEPESVDGLELVGPVDGRGRLRVRGRGVDGHQGARTYQDRGCHRPELSSPHHVFYLLCPGVRPTYRWPSGNSRLSMRSDLIGHDRLRG